MVRSDDPRLLRAIDARTRAGADLWVAHTSLPDALVDEMMAHSAIQLRDRRRHDEPRGDGAAAPRPAAAST